jgi:adenosine deaminase
MSIRRVLLVPVLSCVTTLAVTLMAPAPVQASEQRAARVLDSLREYPGELQAFVRAMPKGADLHSHLSGAVYAETFLAWAAQKELCATPASTLVSPPCEGVPGNTPVSQVATNPDLYTRLINAWSMRSAPKSGPDNFLGHDQFFATFALFGPAGSGMAGGMLAEATARAARGKVSYLELMQTLDGGVAMGLSDSLQWTGDFDAALERLKDVGIDQAVKAAIANAKAAVAQKDSLLACGTATADSGCGVTVKWLYQVLREGQPQRVFAQILTGFMLAQDGSEGHLAGVVGLNLVQPEDGYLSMRDYALHMQMIGYLRTKFPDVNVTLHAGELAAGLVPPEGLGFHISHAVRVAGAQRIGHGVAVMYEDKPYDLLKEMKEKNVLVEICLSSNEGILGITGKDHPLRTYLNNGVPVALATDDEGVSRSDISLEYFKAATQQGLGYATLKQMARNSVAHSFASAGEKARLQAKLEADFSAFEAQYAAPAKAAVTPAAPAASSGPAKKKK